MQVNKKYPIIFVFLLSNFYSLLHVQNITYYTLSLIYFDTGFFFWGGGSQVYTEYTRMTRDFHNIY